MFDSRSLKKFNTEILQDLESEALNFGMLYTPADGKKVSVIATYRPLNGEGRYLGLNSRLEEEVFALTDDSYQYGISTKISAEKIVGAISKLTFRNGEGLDGFIRENCDCYRFHASQRGKLLAMARFFTLNLTYFYCLKIRLRDGAKLPAEFDKETAYDEKTGVCTLVGNPSEKLLSCLSDRLFTIRDGIACQTDGQGMNIAEVYSRGNIISLYNTDLFYSGALLRPLEIVQEDAYVSNCNVTTLNICFEKSSYGTVCALDNDRAKFHWLISPEDRKKIEEFFREEDEVTRSLAADCERGELERINSYLQRSANVHQIVVSANICTEDKILLVPLRGARSIDGEKAKGEKDCLYPGVNGNAEVRVGGVGFYEKSSYEDLPCISVDGGRIDFSGELSRETYSELKINADPMLWDMYGISMNGTIYPGEVPTDTPVRRRMHFNVLAIQHVPHSFSEVCRARNSATEKYESDSLWGIRAVRYRNVFDLMGIGIRSFFDFMRRNGDILTAILSLLVFFTGLGEITLRTAEGISNVVTAVIAVLLIISSVTSIVIKILRYKTDKKYIIRRYLFLYDKQNKKSSEVMHKLSREYKLPAPTYILLKLYFMSQESGDK